MSAEQEATRSYHEKFPGLSSAVLGRTGLHVSRAGFGSYRVSSGVEGHAMALRRALTGGINLIDTSANYADGAGEELIGETLAGLFLDGSLTRKEVVVVSKGGYIQGSNHAIARERQESGSGFPEVVEYARGLWHCISPEFLQDQITRSLNRLRLPSLDVYLLHNPEYYLSWGAKQGLDLDVMRAEYYRRIRAAFEYLEEECGRGRISWYGISSNSFPSPSREAGFTSLDEVIRIAGDIGPDHRFAVIQFPANLYESGFVLERNQPGGKTLIELAREKDLGVLINRPLNAILGNSLIRLAEFPSAASSVGEKEITELIDRVAESEKTFVEGSLPRFAGDPRGMNALERFISVGETIREHWTTFGSIEHFNDVLSQHFAPRFSFTAQYLRENGEPQDLAWFESYVGSARALLHAVGAFYSVEAQARSSTIRAGVEAAVGHPVPGPLSSQAVRLLLGVEGVDSVLVGMRREEYVDDILAALRLGPLGDEETWKRLEI